ncbi:A-kinase anchor protein 17A [Paragonimus heterotremus]|uniref:A-kinase anchor protein 17A n=1 Tax=Paragonimus heterotremus TaxID=100268 RepID=A0A8J4T6A1_9TREM|nr:A-kinase anchor protein 17A [Paragonimus heterotremus]
MEQGAQSSISGKDAELRTLAKSFGLYLKPVARIHLTVQLPTLHDSSGQAKSFTTWEIIEKLRQLCPSVLSPPTPIRIVRTTLEFVRLLVEVDCKSDVKRVVTSLDSQYIKLSGFPQNLHVRASEAPSDCPRRHDWEAFFRDAEDTDETKPGERPDTLVLSGLPVRWFSQSTRSSQSFPEHLDPSDTKLDRPVLAVVKAVFETFGVVRSVDIPMLDPVQNPSCLDWYLDEYCGIRTNHAVSAASAYEPPLGTTDQEAVGGFGKIGPDTISVVSDGTHSVSQVPMSVFNATLSSLDTESASKAKSVLTPLTFIAYVQYNDYTGFTKAMESLRGHKLVYAPQSPGPNAVLSEKTNTKLYFTAEIKIDFDRTKHLSKSSIQARQTERQRLVQLALRQRKEAKAQAEAEARQRRLIEDANRKAEERRQAEALAMEAEQMANCAARAERKKQRVGISALERCKREKDKLVKQKILLDERRRLLALRKVEAIRLITFLLTRIQARHDAIVAERRAIRLARAEQAALEAEAVAAMASASMVTVSKPRSTTDAAVHCPDLSGTAQTTKPPNSPLPSAADSNVAIVDDGQDRMLRQLLKKREEHLRMLLLKKHVGAIQRRSSNSPPHAAGRTGRSARSDRYRMITSPSLMVLTPSTMTKR